MAKDVENPQYSGELTQCLCSTSPGHCLTPPRLIDQWEAAQRGVSDQ